MDVFLVPRYSPTLPSFFLVFLFVYLFSYFVVFRKWGQKQRSEASSSFMSLVHGIPAVVMSIQALVETPGASFASPNSASHKTILEFGMAYFLMDLLHYVVFFPNDILFILHHLATLYVLATCRCVVDHGAYGLLVLLLLAEVTSPFQNVWSIAGYRRVDVPAAAKVHKFLSPPFLAFYSVVRGILAPLYVFKMCSFYLSGAASGMVPAWAWISWMVVIVVGILVSIMWVKSRWIRWFREISHKAQKKVW